METKHIPLLALMSAQYAFAGMDYADSIKGFLDDQNGVHEKVILSSFYEEESTRTISGFFDELKDMNIEFVVVERLKTNSEFEKSIFVFSENVDEGNIDGFKVYYSDPSYARLVGNAFSVFEKYGYTEVGVMRSGAPDIVLVSYFSNGHFVHGLYSNPSLILAKEIQSSPNDRLNETVEITESNLRNIAFNNLFLNLSALVGVREFYIFGEFISVLQPEPVSW